MFRTKQDVDRHVTNLLGKIRDERERNSRGYQVSRLYFDVGEYQTARRYLSSYLSIREDVPQAHRLMGQIYDALSEKQAAIASYKRSLQLNERQNDLILKICDLLCQTSVEPQLAKYWVDRASELYPNNDIVFRLKEKIAKSNGLGDMSDLENLIANELVKKPADVSLRIKLLKLYLSSGKLNEAYDHAVEIDRAMAFVDSLEWFEYLIDLYQQYQKQYGCVGDTGFYTQKLHAQSTCVYLKLKSRECAEASDALHMFDISLNEAVQISKKNIEWDNFVREMKGRFYFLCGILLMKRALKGQMFWKDVCPYSAVCFLISHKFQPIDIQSEWYVKVKQEKGKFYDYLYKSGFFRRSQGGHVVDRLFRNDLIHPTDELQAHYCTRQGREKLFDMLFTLREMKNAKNKSYLMQCDAYFTTAFCIPVDTQLMGFDKIAHQLYPSDLDSLVWIGIQNFPSSEEPQKPCNLCLFDKLQFSASNISNGAPETLSQIDIEAFLYASVYCSSILLKEQKSRLQHDSCYPELLPLCLEKQLCTDDQAEWWMAAYQFYAGTVKEEFAKQRVTLQRGLETIRLVGNHGMASTTIVHLARCFEFRANILRDDVPNTPGNVVHAVDLEERGVFYWTGALELLNRLGKNHSIRMPKERMFVDDQYFELSPDRVKSLIDEATFSIAMSAMRASKHEEAIRGFETVTSNPWASYHLSRVYKTMAEEESVIQTDTTGQRNILYSKARDALYLTLDKLRGDKQHALNKILHSEIDEIETVLNRLEDTEVLVDSISNISLQVDPDVEPPSASIVPHSTPAVKGRMSFQNINNNMLPSVPRIPPSPERLDAQIRSLTLSQDTAMKNVMDKYDDLARMNREMMEKLSDLKEKFTDFKSQILEEVRSIKDENKTLKDQLQQKVQSSQMPVIQPPVPHPAATQVPPTTSYMMPPFRPQYGYNPQSGLLPQYGYLQNNVSSYRPVSPRLSRRQIAMYGKQMEAEYSDDTDPLEDIYHVDGEYFEDDGSQQQNNYGYNIPNSELVQEWPFGHRAGLEGKSTVTYSPAVTKPPMPQPGYFASALRGQALQYGYQQPSPSGSVGSSFFTQTPTGLQSSGAQPSALLAALAGKPDLQDQYSHVPGSLIQSQQSSSDLLPQLNVPSISSCDNICQSGGSFLPPSSAITQTQVLPTTPPGKPPPSAAASRKDGTIQTSVHVLFSELGTYKSNVELDCTIKVLFFPQDKRSVIQIDVQGKMQFIICEDLGVVNFVLTSSPECISWQTDKGTVLLKFESSAVLEKFRNVVARIQTTLASLSKPQHSTNVSQTITSVAKSQTVGNTSVTTSLGTSASNIVQPSTSTKTVFGGFSFYTSPNISTTCSTTSQSQAPKTSPGVKKDSNQTTTVSSTSQPNTTSSPQVKPFANFSLVKSSAASATVSTGSNVSSFAEIAASGSTVFQTKSAFSDANKTSVKPVSHLASPIKSPSKDEHVEEFEPNIDFKPVVPLPDLVDVKTGEEEEQKMFGERSKLFRYDSETGQWKERGLGEMKILKQKDKERYRLLMRREQVLKLCANHAISKDIKLTPMLNSDKAWCWTAMDYSEEEGSMEKLALKFKNSELASKFKDVFESCQKKMESSPSPKKSPVSKPVKSPAAGKSGGDLSTLFKPKAGSWECSGCYTRNDKDTIKCPCCGTLQPGAKSEDIPKDNPSTGELTFGATAGCSPFSSTASSTSGGLKFLDGATGTQSSLPTGFSFAKPTVSSKDSSQSSGFKFGLTTSGTTDKINFGTSSNSDNIFSSSDTSTTKSGFQFGAKSVTTSSIAQTSSFTQSTVGDGGSKPSAFQFGTKPADSNQQTTLTTQTKSSTPFTVQETSKPVSPKQTSKPVNTTGPLSGLFKPKQGSWECSGCLCRNDSSVVKCPACGTTKPGESTDKSKAPAVSTPAAAFTFGSASGGFTFGTTKASTSFSFGPPTTTVSSSTSSPFGSTAFSTPTLTSKSGSKENDSVTKSVDGQYKFTFNMSPSASTVKSAKSPDKGAIKSPKSPGEYYVNDEDEQNIYFEPVVPLPDKIDVKTGEENENVLFEHRAKLYRFTKGEWKERGLGNIKILEHTESRKIRVLMRREAVHKICCNHYLTPELELKPMLNSEGKAWVWFALDFSDGEQIHEQLSVKFKTAEIANNFKTAFDNAKTRTSPSGKPADVLDSDSKKVTRNLFKDTDTDSGIEFLYEEKATEEQITMARKYQLPDNFYLYENKPPCPGCIGCEDADKVKKSPKPRDQKVQVEKVSSSSTRISEIQTTDTGGFGTFSTGDDSFSFSALAAGAKSTTPPFKKDDGKPFSWANAGQQLFREDADEVAQGEDIHFEPVVPLPELVEVKTGEEDENAVFSQRAKLYRYDKDVGQWKEKGIGEMKILKHKETGRYRLLLRREQIFKLACNHALTTGLVMQPLPTSEKSWCWIATDYSESEPKVENFAVRFKNIDIANQFKTKFDECQADIKMTGAESPVKPAATVNEEQADDDDEYEDVDDDEYEDSIPLFEKRATLYSKEDDKWMVAGMGCMKVLEDDDVSGFRILMESDHKEYLCNHIIAQETNIEKDTKKKQCLWAAADFTTDEAVWREFKVMFSSPAVVDEFYNFFQKGIQLAVESGISEKNMMFHFGEEIDVPERVDVGQEF